MQKTDVLIVGAGPAGLAVSACLSKSGIPNLILEKSADIGHSWRNHYDRLHLHTEKKQSALPFLPFGKEVQKYPSRAEVVAYLDRYAEHFDIRPLLNQEVDHAEKAGKNWEVRTRNKDFFSAPHLVIATGVSAIPRTPTLPGAANFQGEIIHSSDYKNHHSLQGKRVLVVGFGNSAAEIALDLADNGIQTALSVRSPVNVVPRDFGPFSSITIGIYTRFLPPALMQLNAAMMRKRKYGDLRDYGLTPSPKSLREQVLEDGKIPVIDLGTMQHIRDGVLKVFPGIREISGGQVKFSDGQKETFDLILLGTGYEPRLDFLQDPRWASPLKKSNLPKVIEKPSGLYFCGFQLALGGALREMGKDAKRISKHIRKRLK